MITKEILINIPNDLDARPIALLFRWLVSMKVIYMLLVLTKINAKSTMGMIV